jgi:hypothetical protein
LANREQLITRLWQVAEGEEGRRKRERRRWVAQMFVRLRQERIW